MTSTGCFKPGTFRLPSIVASDWRASSSSDAGADAPCDARCEYAAVNETRPAKHRTHAQVRGRDIRPPVGGPIVGRVFTNDKGIGERPHAEGWQLGLVRDGHLR